MRSGKLALVALGIILLGAVWFSSTVLDSFINPPDTIVDEEIPVLEEDSIPEENDSNDSSTSELRDGDSGVLEVIQVTSSFQKGDDPYDISGDLIVTRQGDDVSISLSDFSVTAGPDLFIYLVDTDDTSNEGVKAAVENGNFVNLEELKGNIGNQNYTVSGEVDIDEYDVVSVWCKQFERNFGHAVFEF